MSTRHWLAAAWIASLAGLFVPQRAHAARVLFVSDDGSDAAIVDVLRADGHDVTSMPRDFASGMNPSLEVDLSGFDCVVWSACTDDSGTLHLDSAAFRNLTDYATNGGSVFVTGYGAVGLGDAQLIQFLGGTEGHGFTGQPEQIVDLDTNLTTGVVDIRGIVPSSFGRFSYESLGGLGADTVLIVPSHNDAMAAQWAIRTVGVGHIAWVAGLEDQNVEWTSTGAGPGGAFNAAVRNFVTAATGTASVPGAPRIAFSTPFTAPEGMALMLTVHVTDPEGDSTTFSWDLDGDGTYGDAAGQDAVTIAAGTTDGPSTVIVGVEASDGLHVSHRTRRIAITNVAPVILSAAPTTTAIGQHIRYVIDAEDPGGEHDPLTYTLRIAPASATIVDGVLDWTPTESDITTNGRPHAFALDVDDGDGGLASEEWSMTVLDEHAPSDPTLLYPTPEQALSIAGLHFAVGNASDVDGDPLTYAFELASNDAFDTDLQSSGPVPGSATGITEWSPEPSQLHVGPWWWRVSVSDGHVVTLPIASRFQLVDDPALAPDTGAVDGGIAPAAPRGCGCAIAAPRAQRPWIAVICGLFSLVILQRARRR